MLDFREWLPCRASLKKVCINQTDNQLIYNPLVGGRRRAVGTVQKCPWNGEYDKQNEWHLLHHVVHWTVTPIQFCIRAVCPCVTFQIPLHSADNTAISAFDCYWKTENATNVFYA